MIKFNSAVSLLHVNSAMALVLLLIIVVVIQVASSQPTVKPENNKVERCERNEETINYLVSSISELRDLNREIMKVVSKIRREIARKLPRSVVLGYVTPEIGNVKSSVVCLKWVTGFSCVLYCSKTDFLTLLIILYLYL